MAESVRGREAWNVKEREEERMKEGGTRRGRWRMKEKQEEGQLREEETEKGG